LATPRFLADEDLRHPIVKAVRRREPAVEFATIVELALAESNDSQVLEYANTHGWLVVSHDVNTMKASAEQRIATGLPLSGLFLVPQTRSTREVADSLILIWSASTLEEWQDRIVYLPL
jgi:hypothetical protein